MGDGDPPKDTHAEPGTPPASAGADARGATDATGGPSDAEAPGSGAAPTGAPEPAPETRTPPPRTSWLDLLAEPDEIAVEVSRARLASQSRRDFLLLGAGALVTALGGWWLLPDQTRGRLVGMARRDRLDTLAARLGLPGERRERLLDRALTFDDDIAEALYSKDRRVRTYRRADVKPLRNNYHGRTPGSEYLATWTLRLTGLASGRDQHLTIEELRRFQYREQITRLVCVEGWSTVAWWGGIQFADVLAAYPPAPAARWAALRSTVSLDRHGQPETYYVSIDLPTAEHPQTLLATHKDRRPLPLAHGAPLRLVAPMKLGLKNIKAITHIEYTAAEPPDYWKERGYSAYDGL